MCRSHYCRFIITAALSNLRHIVRINMILDLLIPVPMLQNREV